MLYNWLICMMFMVVGFIFVCLVVVVGGFGFYVLNYVSCLFDEIVYVDLLVIYMLDDMVVYLLCLCVVFDCFCMLIEVGNVVDVVKVFDCVQELYVKLNQNWQMFQLMLKFGVEQVFVDEFIVCYMMIMKEGVELEFVVVCVGDMVVYYVIVDVKISLMFVVFDQMVVVVIVVL